MIKRKVTIVLNRRILLSIHKERGFSLIKSRTAIADSMLANILVVLLKY